MPFSGPHFKHADTHLLVVLGILYGVIATAGWSVLGPTALPALLGFVLLLAVGVMLHLHRERQAEVTHALNHTQALLALHTVLDLRAPLPRMSGWAASAELAATVADLVLERRPNRVLELGSGTSSIVIGYALEQLGGGQLLSLDHDDAYAGITSKLVERHGLGKTVTIRTAPLVQQSVNGLLQPWYDLSSVDLAGFAGREGIDLLIVDGPPRESASEARYPALPLLLDLLRIDAVIVLDDALRVGERIALARWQNEVPGLSIETIPSAKGIAVIHRHAAMPFASA